MDGDKHDAWNDLHEAQRAGWYVGIPLYNVQRRRWQLYAFDTTEKVRTDPRGRELTTLGQSEDECVREMARFLREFRRVRLTG